MGATFVVGCGSGSSSGVTAPVASAPVLTVVRISLSSDTLLVGQSATASVTGLDQNSAVIDIGAPTWSTTSPSIATVSPSGVVSAVAPGQTMLIASVNGKQGQQSLTILQAAISRLSMTPDAPRVVRGTTLQLTASALDFNGRALPGRAIVWTSSDGAKATVTSTGFVTALSPGVVTIVATSEGVSASSVVTVTGSVDSVATVTVSPATSILKVGGTVQLAATLKDDAGNTLTGRAVTWSVTGIRGAGVATVSGAGFVNAESPGTVIVEAFCEGRHGAATITVNDDVDSTIVVTFAAPVENALVGDTLLVIVGVKSLYPLASVVAAVGPMRTLLTLKYQRVGALGGSYLWTGSIDITDIPSGPCGILVTATDNRGAHGLGSRQFQRDTRKDKGGSGTPPKQK